jgi:hypothetical protein
MDATTKLLTAIASLVGAVAWPATLLVVIFVFRDRIRSALDKVPLTLDRLTKVTLAGVALELDRVADAELESGADKSGKVTPRQFEAAARIAVQTRDVGSQALLGQLDTLGMEYDSLRRTLPAGENRTRAMTRIVVKMRSLAPSLINFLDVYKGSGSAGSRLAAIAMMQMVPSAADVDWLKDRFSSESPFLFYHAALALQNMADHSSSAQVKQKVREVAVQALAKIKSFSGAPDQNTVEVLEMLISSLPPQK